MAGAICRQDVPVGPSKAEEVLATEEGRAGGRETHTRSGLDFQKMVPR